jgi:hypothetical protein
MKKLILIEGLPGSGKSTTAQWLHHSFQKSQMSSSWYYELSVNHPLSYKFDKGNMTGSQLLTESLDIWQRFIHSSMSECEATIIDSGFFQKNIMHLMNLSVDAKTILQYASQVEALLSQFDTYFVYLDSSNAEVHMQSAFNLRGKRFQEALTVWANKTEYSASKGYQGTEGCLKYWRDYKSLCDRIYERLKFNKIEIDVATGQWSEHYRTLSRFLAVSNYENIDSASIVHGNLSGDYLLRDSDVSVKVTEMSGSYVIKNLLDVLEVESLMIPVGSNRFFIRGHDVSIQFDEFRKGVAGVMKVSSSWNKLDGCIFERITS